MTTIDFASRSSLDELMDTEPVTFDEFDACLVDLATVNRWSRAYVPTVAFFERLAPRLLRLGRPIEIVDVGSGHGDMLRAIDAWADRCGIDVRLTGVDLNPWSRASAMATTPPRRYIEWVTADVFAFEPERGVDVVVSSLFTHHLPDPLVVKFVRWMESTARVGWFVNDLHRHPVPYHFFRHFAKLARFHRFVQHDGPVSIARAFSRGDWTRLLATAELDDRAATVRWELPFRLTVERLRAE